jgi:hypothetical protein
MTNGPTTPDALTSIGMMQLKAGLMDDAISTVLDLQQRHPDFNGSAQTLLESAFKEKIRPWRDFLGLPIPEDDSDMFQACRADVLDRLTDFLTTTIIPSITTLLDGDPALSDDTFLFFVRIRADALRFTVEWSEVADCPDEFERVRASYEEGHVFARQRELFWNMNYLKLMANYTNFIAYRLEDRQLAFDLGKQVCNEFHEAQLTRPEDEISPELAESEFAVLEIYPGSPLANDALS